MAVNSTKQIIDSKLSDLAGHETATENRLLRLEQRIETLLSTASPRVVSSRDDFVKNKTETAVNSALKTIRRSNEVKSTILGMLKTNSP
jgi:Holliday junction resolvasome RuvABC endonuclease subunit